MARSLSLCGMVAAVVLAACSLPARAQTQACAQFTWDVSREIAVMKQSPRAVTAASRPGPQVPALEPGKLYELKLSAQSDVQYIVKPAKPASGDGARGGLARFRVSKAGVYRISISSGHWIDVVDGGQFVPSRDFQGGHGCERPHKIVEFELPAGRDLTLQLSRADAASVIVAITPAGKQE